MAELPLDLQTKLLRVLQDGQFERLGSTKTLHVDVRVIAASNRDLTKAVADGRFREDLYYRLNVFPIVVPPLRERPDDIPLLAWTFAKRFGIMLGKPVERIPREVMEALQRYPWPGNVRELRNAIERAIILADSSTLRLPPGPVADYRTQDSLLTVEDAGRSSLRAHILSVLEPHRLAHSRGRGRRRNPRPQAHHAGSPDQEARDQASRLNLQLFGGIFQYSWRFPATRSSSVHGHPAA